MLNLLKKISHQLYEMTAILRFFISRKKWELLPIVIILILIGLILIAAESTLISPIIYTVF